MCFFWPHLTSPQPPSSLHPALTLITARQLSNVATWAGAGWWLPAHLLAVAGSCWRPSSRSGRSGPWPVLGRKDAGRLAWQPGVPVTELCRTPAWYGLTPPAGHPLGTSSRGHLSSSFIISMQVGRGSLGLPSSPRGLCAVLVRSTARSAVFLAAPVVPICTRVQHCAACS